MIAVIFEVYPAEGSREAYLDIAAKLRPVLETMDGFISVERFESLSTPGKLLSLSIWRDEPPRGGALFGAGIGIGFLGTGVDSLAIQLASGLALALHPAWRNRGTALAWLAATAVALVLILPWPLLLWRQSPALFDIWWNVEQTSLTSRGGISLAHLELLAWAS